VIEKNEKITNLEEAPIEEKKEQLTKKAMLMNLEAELILIEQIEETRIMTKEMDIDKNYEILALTFGYCCFFSAALPITVFVMWIFSL